MRPLIAWTAALTVTAGVVSGCSGSAHKAPTAFASPAPAPPPGVPVSALARMRWTALPPDPLGPRQQAVTAWTGHELLAVGGSPVSGNGPGLVAADAYDPLSRAWQLLPDFPLAARASAASAWTSYGLVMWGGETNPGGERALTRLLGDGAILDVGKRQWHILPAAPLPALTGPVAVTDATDRVIVMGGEPQKPQRGSGSEPLASRLVASYDPAKQAWRLLPSLPAIHHHDLVEVSAVRWGAHILVAATWEHIVPTGPGSIEGSGGVDLYLLDPGSGHWSPFTVSTDALVGADLRPLGSSLAVGGGTSCPPGASCPFSLSAFSVVDARGQELSRVPAPPIQLRAETVVGESYVAMTGTERSGPGIDEQPGDAAAFDLPSKHWIALPSARAFKPEPESLTWTGRELIAVTPAGLIALQSS